MPMCKCPFSSVAHCAVSLCPVPGAAARHNRIEVNQLPFPFTLLAHVVRANNNYRALATSRTDRPVACVRPRKKLICGEHTVRYNERWRVLPAELWPVAAALVCHFIRWSAGALAVALLVHCTLTTRRAQSAASGVTQYSTVTSLCWWYGAVLPVPAPAVPLPHSLPFRLSLCGSST